MRVVVTTSPRYSHIIPTFARAFRRAWPDCPWPVTVLYSGAPDRAGPLENWPAEWPVHRSPEPGWAASLLAFLAGSDEPFLLLLDDYILDVVDREVLLLAGAIIERIPAVGMVRVHPCPGPTRPWSGDLALGLFGRIDKAEPYAISLQAALWRPQVCRDLFRWNEDPWQTEIVGSQRARDYPDYDGRGQGGVGGSGYDFIGTHRSALGYRELMKRGREIPETRAWVEAHL